MSETTLTVGTGDALGWPEMDQVATPMVPSTASSTRSAPQPLACTIGRTNTSAAPSTPSRIRCAAPYWLASTSRTSEPVMLPSPPPATYGTCSTSSRIVASATIPAPTQITWVGPLRDSRCGHSRASTSTAPTSSSSPTYPIQRTTGSAASTAGEASAPPPAALGGPPGDGDL